MPAPPICQSRTSPGASILVAALGILAALPAAPAPARAGDGPGLGNLTYSPAELFQPVSVIRSEPVELPGITGGIPVGHGNVAMVNGYLMVIYSLDGGGISLIGGIEFYDVSDPRDPALVRRYDDEHTRQLREPHGFGLARIDGRDVLVAQGVEGILFWDVTDPLDIEFLHHLDLPDISQGDYTGDWWVFWQAPYVYVAGTGSGLFIVDARDPREPQLAARVPTSESAGLSPGQVFALGNLLLLAKNEGGTLVTMDLSAPEAPELIQRLEGRSGYSHLFAAGRVLTSGDSDRRLHVHRVEPDGTMAYVASAGAGLGKGGYGSYQDGFFLGGFSDRAAKLDVAGLEQVGDGSSGLRLRDEDFGQVLGNLVFAGDDHGVGSALLPHQLEPDGRGPEVHWVHPPDGAEGLPVTTRVGLSFSDHVDLDSLDAASFAVRPVGGEALEGLYSVQFGLANFAPAKPLDPGTVYEVEVAGVRDWAGNAGGVFRSTFRTGGEAPPTCRIGALPPGRVGEALLLAPESVVAPGPLSHRWTVGDEEPPAEESSEPGLLRIFEEAGRYPVVLEVEGPTGTGRCSGIQIVHHPLAPAPPSASTPILYAHGASWNVNPDNDTVTGIDGESLDVLFETPVGSGPRSLARAPDGRIWVVCQGDATLHVLSPSGAPSEVIALPHGSRPFGVAFRPDGAAAVVSLGATGQLLELSPDARPLRLLSVGERPRGLAIRGDSSRIYVARFVSPGDRGELRVVDAEHFALEGVLPLGFDLGPDTESSGRGVPNYLGALALRPDDRSLLVPSKKDNVARGLFRDGLLLSFESRVRTIVSEVDLVAGREEPAGRVDLNDRDLAQAALYTPLGGAFLVAAQGSNRVEILDGRTRERLGGVNTGRAPQGLAWNGDGSRLFVHNFLSRSVSVYDSRALVEGRANTVTPLAEVPTVAAESLDPAVLRGKRIFYDASDPRMSRDGYLSCASCHLDGGSDGRVWDFTQVGEGLRNTIELRGRGGLGHGRVHWTANFDEIQDFENDIRGAFSGAGFLEDADFESTRDPLGAPKAGLSAELDDLAAYVSSLDAVPDSPERRADGARDLFGWLGRAVFATRGCPACHQGDRFSDGRRHDVGTLRPGSGLGLGEPLEGVGFETPTLKGLWLTPPYLHDGQAAELAEVLRNPVHMGGSLHPLEALVLERYLRQIDEREHQPACSDGLDNDGDGAVDFASDPECTSVFQDDEQVRGAACGLGGEGAPLALTLALARWAGRRRRGRAYSRVA